MSGPANDFGVVEWFALGDRDRVRQCLDRMASIDCKRMRTHLSWADYHSPGGKDWYDWLLPTLAEQVSVLPCIHYTPPSLSETGETSGPPRDLDALANFIDHVIDRYGELFDEVELWNEPNNRLDWNWNVDGDWLKYCTMIGAAAHWAQHRGKTVVLGGPCPNDMNWLRLIGERGIFGVVDAIGLHGFPGTWDSPAAGWTDWHELVEDVRATIAPFANIGIWITEAGYSTWRSDPAEQARRFLNTLEAPVDRVYWYALDDLSTRSATQEGLRFDQRHYHLGMHDDRGRPKLLARLLARGGVAEVARAAALGRTAPAITGIQPVLVTGGAGFIGANLADRLCREGHHVLVLDSFARDGVEDNLAALKADHGRRITAALVDLRDHDGVAEAARDACCVFHFAAQVAVTSSLDDPLQDFAINAAGTLCLLETLRGRSDPPPLIFASTNKVYGSLDDVALDCTADGYRPSDPDLAAHGVAASRPLDFHTPYGCSKGTADQYVLDYARSFGLQTAVMRMSCIYGQRQCGTEDQGWVAHFALQALAGETVTLFGDGLQVRDILHVDDAVDAYLALWSQIGRHTGRAFNLGGGPANAVSLRQVLDELGRLTGQPVSLAHGAWRPGDQRWYVSDIRPVKAALGLDDPANWRIGLRRMVEWMAAARGQARVPERAAVLGGR